MVRLLPALHRRVGQAAGRGRQGAVRLAAGQQVADFWKTLYSEGLAPNEKYNGDSFADGKAAMAIVGPWAVAVYGDKVDWGVAPVPTSDGKPAGDIQTFSDEKSIAMYSACKNRGTAWDVLKFATSKEQDGAFLDATGQMPMRTDLPGTYPEYFDKRAEYKPFADQAARIVEVPNVANSRDDLADVPRRLLEVGHLRQGGAAGRAERRGRQGRDARAGRGVR